MQGFRAFTEDNRSVVLYHGTSSNCVELIQRLGLKPQFSGKGAYEWSTAAAPRMEIPEPDKAIYLSSNLAIAKRYAYLTQASRGGSAVILHIRLNSEHLGADDDSGDPYAFKVTRIIKPKLIERIEELPDNPEYAKEYARFMNMRDPWNFHSTIPDFV